MYIMYWTCTAVRIAIYYNKYEICVLHRFSRPGARDPITLYTYILCTYFNTYTLGLRSDCLSDL